MGIDNKKPIGSKTKEQLLNVGFHQIGRNPWRSNWVLLSNTIYSLALRIWNKEVDKQQQQSYQGNPGRLEVKQQVDVHPKTKRSSVLGLQWTVTDASLKLCKTTNKKVEAPITQRKILSIISLLFDQIGLFASSSVHMRWVLKNNFTKEPMLLQSMWSASKKRNCKHKTQNLLESLKNFAGERYEMGMRWSEPEPNLPNNYSWALGQLNSLERRFQRYQNLKRLYQQSIDTDVEKGFLKILDKSETKGTFAKEWYLQNNPVLNPTKPGKVRRVCNAASKYKEVRINDKLLAGADLLHGSNFQIPWKTNRLDSWHRINVYERKFSNRIQVAWGSFDVQELTNLFIYGPEHIQIATSCYWS